MKATRTYLKRLSGEFRNDNSNLKGYLREFALATIDIPLAKLGNTERVSLLLSSIPDDLSYRVIRDLNLDTEDTETIFKFNGYNAPSRFPDEVGAALTSRAPGHVPDRSKKTFRTSTVTKKTTYPPP